MKRFTCEIEVREMAVNLQVRMPERMHELLTQAAEAGCEQRTTYVRRAVVEALKRDGLLDAPASLSGAVAG